MYTLTRAPSKLAAKASRRGPSQQIDKFDGRLEFVPGSNKREPFQQYANGCARSHYSNRTMSSPRPVFNSKRNYHYRSQHVMTQEAVSPQHEENVRFVADAWHEIVNRTQNGPEVYQDKQSNQNPDFEPFNLQQWWVTRTFPEKVHAPS